MKEIKTTTTYSEEKIKTFLKIYYFERIKTTRILINILIAILIIYFFIIYYIPKLYTTINLLFYKL